MRTDTLFNDIKNKENIKLLSVDSKIRTEFENKYYKLQDKLFYEFMQNCGGIIIDN